MKGSLITKLTSLQEMILRPSLIFSFRLTFSSTSLWDVVSHQVSYSIITLHGNLTSHFLLFFEGSVILALLLCGTFSHILMSEESVERLCLLTFHHVGRFRTWHLLFLVSHCQFWNVFLRSKNSRSEVVHKRIPCQSQCMSWCVSREEAKDTSSFL